MFYINWLEPGAPIPANHGAAGDLLHDIRELRLTMQRELDILKKRESEIKDALLGVFDPVKYPGAIGQRYKTVLTTEKIATIKEWELFHGYVRQSGRFDMLQKRANSGVIIDEQERLRQYLPGVEMMIVKDLSITKR